MKRIHLFEFEDQAGLPTAWREGITGFLDVMHAWLKTHESLAGRLAGPIERTGAHRIVDCCSGSGGLTTALVHCLREEYGLDVRAVLTDLFPPWLAVRKLNQGGGPVSYHETPVHAASIPAHLSGFRTLMCGFHHLRPEAARTVLEDAFRRRQPIAVFEITRNCFTAWTATLLVPLAVLAVIPFVRPWRWSYFLFTYVIPVLPFLLFWDGLISNLRTYSPSDLQQMIAGLGADDYRWEVGVMRLTNRPYGSPYLIGEPVLPGSRTGPADQVIDSLGESADVRFGEHR